MADRALLDTNILVYAVESGGPAASKSQLARLAIGQPRACVSTQILGEFYAATTSARRASPLTHVEAVAWIQFWKRLEVLDVTVAHVDLAVEIVDDYRVNYYDALILATARLGDCRVVLSEDLSHGQDYGGVVVRNPLDARQ